MEINKSKTIEINWLGNCPTCDREEHMVSTSEGNKDYLYEDDTVKCWCGQTGVIETDGEGHAWCNWDKKAATEWDNFNLYYRQKFPEYWDLLPKANHQACQHHEELFNSWVEAKSQVMPESPWVEFGFPELHKDESSDCLTSKEVFFELRNSGGTYHGWYIARPIDKRDQCCCEEEFEDSDVEYEYFFNADVGDELFDEDHIGRWMYVPNVKEQSHDQD